MDAIKVLMATVAAFGGLAPALADCPTSTNGPFGGQVSSVSVQGNLIYATEGDDVVVIDASNRTAPEKVGRLNAGRLLLTVRVKGTQGMMSCAIGNQPGLMRTLDVSSPTAPTQAGIVTPDLGSSGTAFEMDLGSGFALGLFGGQVSVYNTANPATPIGATVGTFSNPSVGAWGSNGFVSANLSGGGVRLLTYSWNGTTLTNLATLNVPGSGVSAETRTLAVNGSVAVLGTNSGLRAFDVSNPAAPTAGGTLSLSSPLVDLAISGHIAVGVNFQTLHIFDVANPAAPTLLSTMTIPNLSPDLSVSIDGSLVAIGSPGAGVYVVDVTNPAAPTSTLVHSVAPASFIRASTSGDVLAIANRSGIQFVDATDRTNPRVTQFVPTLSGVIERSGPYLFTYGGVGFRVYDVSNPTLPPVQLPDVPIPTIPNAFPGPFAFTRVGGADWIVAAYVGQSGALAAFRMTSPTTPQFFTILPPGIQVRGNLAVGGERAVLSFNSGASPQSIQVINLSPLGAQPPQQPTVLGTLTISAGPATLGRILVVNNYAYVPVGATVNIVDVHAAPVMVGSFTVPSSVGTAQYVNGRLCYSSGRNIYFYDPANPLAPTLIRTVAVGSSPLPGLSACDIVGNEAFCSLAELGLLISTLGDCCPPDFNQDGTLDPDDLGDFITCFFADPSCPGADFNHDGEANPDDLGDFITSFFDPAC